MCEDRFNGLSDNGLSSYKHLMLISFLKLNGLFQLETAPCGLKSVYLHVEKWNERKKKMSINNTIIKPNSLTLNSYL